MTGPELPELELHTPQTTQTTESTNRTIEQPWIVHDPESGLKHVMQQAFGGELKAVDQWDGNISDVTSSGVAYKLALHRVEHWMPGRGPSSETSALPGELRLDLRRDSDDRHRVEEFTGSTDQMDD